MYCVYIRTYIRDSHKGKGNYKGPIEYDPVAGEAASIQDSPMQYDYARTGPIKVNILQYTTFLWLCIFPLKLHASCTYV